MCLKCTSNAFPFNYEDDDDVFLSYLSELWFGTITIDFNNLNEKLCIPFKSNDESNRIPLCETNPNFQQFKKICDYNLILTFNDK